MKATFFFSQKQFDLAQGNILYHPSITRVNGKIYSEVQTSDGEHLSNWEDAVVVHVENNLQVDLLYSELMGTVRAKFPFNIVSIEKKAGKWKI